VRRQKMRRRGQAQVNEALNRLISHLGKEKGYTPGKWNVKHAPGLGWRIIEMMEFGGYKYFTAKYLSSTSFCDAIDFFFQVCEKK